ncbi:MAG: SDR family oxidoreductase [Eubacteriales bacterium]
MDNKVIVITGSSKGIGHGLAECFLKAGHSVVITGTSQKSVDEAAASFEKYSGKFIATVCDVTSKESVEALVNTADKAYGRIDIWINNAGITHSSKSIMELEDDEIKKVVDVNLLGMINGSRAAGKYMLAKKSGSIYNMEGLGSDGRIANGSAYYGTTKRALRYFTRCLAKEMEGTGVIVGRLSPGMALTQLLLKDVENSPNKESTLKIFKILADKVEVVTEYLSKEVLKNQKNGAYIAWLTTPKIMYRFMSAPFTKRDPFK